MGEAQSCEGCLCLDNRHIHLTISSIIIMMMTMTIVVVIDQADNDINDEKGSEAER